MIHEKIPLSNDVIIDQIESILTDYSLPFRFSRDHIQIFQSKKHYVLKCEILSSPLNYQVNQIVIKYFNSRIIDHEKRFANELHNHEILINIQKTHTESCLKIPKIYVSCPNIILYEFILSDMIESLLNENLLSLSHIQKLASYIVELHKFHYYFGDQRLRNFLFSKDGTLYSVDLENMYQGSIPELFNDFCAFCGAFLDYRSNIFKGIYNPFAFNCMIQFCQAYFSHSSTIHLFNSLISKENFRIILVANVLNTMKKTALRRGIKVEKKIWNEINDNLLDRFQSLHNNVL